MKDRRKRMIYLNIGPSLERAAVQDPGAVATRSVSPLAYIQPVYNFPQMI